MFEAEKTIAELYHHHSVIWKQLLMELGNGIMIFCTSESYILVGDITVYQT